MNTFPSPYEGFTGQYIAGEWLAGRVGKTLADQNPYTGATITEVILANGDDLDDAYRAAASAQPAWARLLPAERSALFLRAANIMDARHNEIVSWLIRESGSTRTKAEMEWDAVRGGMLEAASLPARIAGRILLIDAEGKESRVYRAPLGVIGVISPWNWPMHLSGRSIAPALALGNSVVVKPADDTPVACGSLYVVIGEVADIGDAFTLHPIPKFISFTGSTAVGKRIGSLAMTGPTLKPVAVELDVNAPCVVPDDADLDLAVRAAVFGRFLHQGQICMSSNRIIVERFVAQVSALKCGDPNDADTAIGPVINQRQLDGMVKRIAAARDAGMHQRLGGDRKGLSCRRTSLSRSTINPRLLRRSCSVRSPRSSALKAAGCDLPGKSRLA